MRWRARAARGELALAAHGLHRADGTVVELADEPALYAAVGLPWLPPELREGLGEAEAAADGTLPRLIDAGDITGVLHCHSQYSDGGATIAELAAAARARGWTYLGVSDHSQSAFYSGGLTVESLGATRRDRRHQRELLDFRVLKGVEADILPCRGASTIRSTCSTVSRLRDRERALALRHERVADDRARAQGARGPAHGHPRPSHRPPAPRANPTRSTWTP